MTLWTVETKEKAAALWNAGQSASKVAAQFGCSRNAIIGLVNRNQNLFEVKSKRPANPRDWSLDHLETAREMWAKGDPTADIGEAIGRTACAVLKMARYRPGMFPAREKPAFRVVKMLQKKAKPDRPIIVPDRRLDERFPPKSPDNVGVTMEQLTACLCRFPTWGDDEDFNVYTSHYCGAEKDPHGLYCKFHCDAVRGRGTRSEQNAAGMKTRVAA